jgi:hypothetical protein
MTPINDHERCSELLRGYVAGELAASEAEWVAEHTASCDECRAELTAVKALVLPPVEEPTQLELARLHKAVMDATRVDTAPIVIPRKSGALGRRLAPYLGAAATIALLLFAASQVTLSGGDSADSPSAALDAGTEGAETGGDGAGVVPGSTEKPRKSDGKKVLPETASGDQAVTPTSGGSDGGATAALSGPQPVYTSLGKVTPKELEDTAVHDPPFSSFARQYNGRSARALQGRFVRSLSLDAEDGVTAKAIKNCASTVIEQGSNDLYYLPAYAGTGVIDGTRALLIGFAYTLQEKAPLDRFQLWAWERPGCDTVILYRGGPIRG